MRHKESGIRFKITSELGNFSTEVKATLSSSTDSEKPAKQGWSLEQTEPNLNSSSKLDEIAYTMKGGATEIITDYTYFLPKTDVSDLEFKFTSGTIGETQLTNLSSVILTKFTDLLEVNKLYTISLNISSYPPGTNPADYTIPAFNGIIAMGTDGKLTLTGGELNSGARMVYFKYGSIVGMGCTINGTAYKPTDCVFNPTTTTYNSWSAVPNSTNTSGAMTINLTNMRNGRGDPCRLVGYTEEYVKTELAAGRIPDNKLWQTPTNTNHDYLTTANTNWWTSSSSNSLGEKIYGINTTLNNINPLFYPAAGYYSGGGVIDYGEDANYWTSTATSSSNARYLKFTISVFDPHWDYEKTTGMPVRCISQ